MKVITSKTVHSSHTFEVVESFPAGYKVWNIGRHNFNFKSYIPLARPVQSKYAFEKAIDPDTLKAIKVANEDIALKILNIAARGEVDKNYFENILNF